jgi:hypothetical protein
MGRVEGNLQVSLEQRLACFNPSDCIFECPPEVTRDALGRPVAVMEENGGGDSASELIGLGSLPAYGLFRAAIAASSVHRDYLAARSHVGLVQSESDGGFHAVVGMVRFFKAMETEEVDKVLTPPFSFLPLSLRVMFRRYQRRGPQST